MRPYKQFQYYLLNYPSPTGFYVDVNGLIKTSNTPAPLKSSPGGWLDATLKFSMSDTYWSLRRTYSIPLKFVNDGAAIIRSVFYQGRGIEQLIQLVVTRWDPSTDTYRLYYRGILDLSKMVDETLEGVTVNVMEGGVYYLFKAYEKTVFEIPLDGSIPENIKVNNDGILFNDTFHYQMVAAKLQATLSDQQIIIPVTYISNDGSNAGIIKGDQSTVNVTSNGDFQQGTNFLFSSVDPQGTTVNITGNIIANKGVLPSTFSLYFKTSFLNQTPKLVNVSLLTFQQTFTFSTSINLAPNEQLFVVIESGSGVAPQILAGEIDISFSSRNQSSRIWSITAYNVFRLVVQNINKLASQTSVQQFNYGAISSLLQSRQDIAYTSGDGLRASTNPDYFQYFNQKTVNPSNPANQVYNQYASAGANLKISLADLFEDLNPILNACLGSQQIAGQVESLFFEAKSYVFNRSSVIMALGEVAELSISVWAEKFFNWLKVGGPNPQLDEESGKFEYNATAQFQAPVKTVSKTFELVTKASISSYLIEMTRFNTQGGKSTTFNSNDNTRFLMNVDLTSSSPDYYRASFASGVTDPTNPNNTNIPYKSNTRAQGMYLTTLDGEYFLDSTDPTIFLFNQPLSSSPFTGSVSFNAILNGLLTDSATIQMWVNGVVIQTWSQNVTGVNTPFAPAIYNFSRNFSTNDAIWFTITTSITCSVQINSFTLTLSDGLSPAYLTAIGNVIVINPGQASQLIALPTVTARIVNGLPVMTYGFQYFKYFSFLTNNTFNTFLDITTYCVNLLDHTQTMIFTLWKNGQAVMSLTFNATNSSTTVEQVVNENVTYALNDLVWVTVQSGVLTTAEVTAAILTFESNVPAFNLLRKIYAAIAGIPNPTTAYNLEFSPGRMLRANGSLIRSFLFNLIPGQLTFQVEDRNQYLSTTDPEGNTITENANVDLATLDEPLFYPLVFKFKTKIPINFADLINGVANAHISFTFLGNTFYGFAREVSQKHALNDAQEWELLASPENSLALLQSMVFDGLSPNFLNLMPNQFFVSHVCPLKFVPMGGTPNPQYNFIHMDDDWFINQVNFWVHKENYFQKWQMNDPIPIQIITNGVASVDVIIIDCNGKQIVNQAMNVIAGPLQAPYIQLEYVINPTALSLLTGQSYYVILASGGSQPMISEGFVLATTWPVTMLFEYLNSFNKQSTVFSLGYTGAFRVEAWLSEFDKEIRRTEYEDEPANLTLLNAIPYRKFKLNVAATKGVADWVWDKVMDIMSLDTVNIDGKQFTLDAGAKGEVRKTDSWPKRYWSIAVREAKNTTGVTISAGGSIVQNPIVTATTDLNAFGENPSTTPNLIQVQQS